MYTKHDTGVRAPYESPEAEMLLIRLEERLLDGSFTTSQTESLTYGEDGDFS